MVCIRRCFRQTIPHLLAFVIAGITACSAQRFMPDDPLTRTPEVAAVRTADVQHINALYDFVDNSFHYKSKVVTDSLGINTLGEVPDSSWFTNRDISGVSVAQRSAAKRGCARLGQFCPAEHVEVCRRGIIYRLQDYT
jgi:hypothetical protein